MNRRCSNCGAEIQEHYQFCRECGQKIEYEEKSTTVDKKFFCIQCGRELESEWKICPFCGCSTTEKHETKQNDISTIKSTCPKCGNMLKASAKFCPKCGTKRDSSTYMDTARQYTDIAKKKSEDLLNKGSDFINDVKNYKNLSKKKKKTVLTIISGAAVAVIATVIVIFSLNAGVSDEIVSQAALQVAEEDSGLDLELVSYDIIDSFSSTNTNVLGDTRTAKIYLLLLECQSSGDDSNSYGSEDDTILRYGAYIVDPKEKNGQASCDTNSSQCFEYASENEEQAIEQLLSQKERLMSSN